MAHWDRNEFDKFATQIVNAFMAAPNSAPLTELVTKTARDNSLNPEQICRLARAVNTQAFNAKFASMKGQPDRVVDFDLADDQASIAQLFKDASPVEKVAADLYPELSDQLSSHRTPALTPADPTTKLASAFTAVLGAENPEKQYLHWTKVAGELQLQHRQAEIRWQHTMKQIKEAATGYYWDHDAFEKNAVAWFGERAFPELVALRELRKLPEIQFSMDKFAAAQEFTVGTDTPEIQLLKLAIDARERYVALGVAQQQAGQTATTYREQLLHG